MNLSRYLGNLSVQVKNNFVREAVYRTNFLTAVTVDVIWMGSKCSLFSVLYANVIPLWRMDQVTQVYFFLGIFFASDALFTIFFQRNFWNFSDLVNHGELDILLTKPVHPLFLLFLVQSILQPIQYLFRLESSLRSFAGLLDSKAGCIGF